MGYLFAFISGVLAISIGKYINMCDYGFAATLFCFFIWTLSITIISSIEIVKGDK